MVILENFSPNYDFTAHYHKDISNIPGGIICNTQVLFFAHYHKDTSNIPGGCICNTYLLLLLPTIIRIQVIFQEGATALYLFFQKRKNANHVFSPKNTSMKNKVLISIVQTKAIKTKKAILNGEGKNHVVKLLDLCLPLR